ncbi:DUF2339 domain-containing protein, partial [Solirubrobacter phytolaccae]
MVNKGSRWDGRGPHHRFGAARRDARGARPRAGGRPPRRGVVSHAPGSARATELAAAQGPDLRAASRRAVRRAAPAGCARPGPRGTSPLFGEAGSARPGSRAPGHHAAGAPPKRDLEDVVGGSILAWLGGVAILAGLAFLLTIAISRGWLDETMRTVLGGALSAALLATGVYLREHKDRTEAALAAAAVGVAGLFGTLLIAGAGYELIPTATALVGALIVGTTATVLAIRWNAPLMGWLGLLGALWAPTALGALDAVAFLAVAYAATVAVVVWQRWNALAWAAFVTAALQLIVWLWDASPTETGRLVVLVTFGLLTAALAFGLEARRASVNWNAAALLVLNALLLAVSYGDHDGWLIALAAAHFVAGLAATRTPGISRPVALVTLGIAVGLADLALVAMADGLPVVLGWAGPVLAFAALLGARRRPAAVEAFVNDVRLAFPVAPRDDAATGRPAGTSSAAATGAPREDAATGRPTGQQPASDDGPDVSG